MFSDERFNVKQTVDKRGRKVKTSSSDHLQKLYDLPSDEEEDSTASSSEDEESESATKTVGKILML